MSASLRPRILLDANICIRILRDGECRVARRVAAQPPELVAVPAVAVAELMQGISRRGAEALASLDAFLERVPVLAFDAAAARAFPAARAARGKFDRLIAAQALALDALLVTHDIGDFRGVPGLRIEDWTR